VIIQRLRQCITKAALYLNNVEENENGIVLPHICLVDESSVCVNDALQDRPGSQETFATSCTRPRTSFLVLFFPHPFLCLSAISLHVSDFCPALPFVTFYCSSQNIRCAAEITSGLFLFPNSVIDFISWEVHTMRKIRVIW